MTEYAVKKIVLDIKKKSALRIKKEIETVLTEIRCLARIKHENVVKYNQAWIEVVLKEDSQSLKENGIKKLSYSIKERSHGKNLNTQNTQLIQILLILTSMEVSILILESGGSLNFEKNFEDDQETILINKDVYRLKDIRTLNVLIQMELCKETLGDVLKTEQEDHKTIVKKSEEKSQLLPTNKLTKYLKIFLDIVKAINDLHVKEQIIHRDLKPNNIFFTESGIAKIGDFGLATELFNIKYSAQNSSFQRKTSETSNGSSNTCNSGSKSYHTKNVGTLLYASPEQLNENFYDQRSDIYSLGLILFEMVYPLKTGMEKHQRFKELKEESKLPSIFKENLQEIACLILDMTNKDPDMRPESELIIQRINNILVSLNNEGRLKTLTEEFSNNPTYKLAVKIQADENNNEFQIKFLKLINDKLLILSDKHASKAAYIYDLSDCENKINKDSIEVDHPFLNKLIIKLDGELKDC